MVKHLKTDKQTADDLGLFGTPGKPSIYRLFNRTRTHGGAVRLEALFREPLSDENEINKRASTYRFFSDSAYRFPVDAATVGTVAHYMQNDDVRSQLQVGSQSLGQRFMDLVAVDSDEKFVRDGVYASVRLYHVIRSFLEELGEPEAMGPYGENYKKLLGLLDAPAFTDIRDYSNPDDPKIPIVRLADIDKRIRFTEREKTLRLLDEIYDLDVLIAVGQVARDRGFSFATAHPRESDILRFKNVYHPHVENAITNNLDMDNDNILFLTGANMAGKSTLIRSLGIALYLGHMGFPVAASQLDFSVRDGIYTSINLADNLAEGSSHYYTEVLRVKDVAYALHAGNRLLVIFDEIFRGTNVKDAYDATIALIRSFARCTGSSFIISTHIMEAGEHLQKEDLPISYQYLPTEMQGNTPVYTRVLQEGITDDRQGMIIIENEGILEMLDKELETQEGVTT